MIAQPAHPTNIPGGAPHPLGGGHGGHHHPGHHKPVQHKSPAKPSHPAHHKRPAHHHKRHQSAPRSLVALLSGNRIEWAAFETRTAAMA